MRVGGLENAMVGLDFSLLIMWRLLNDKEGESQDIIIDTVTRAIDNPNKMGKNIDINSFVYV